MAAAKHRILFASCNSQHYEADLWPNILARDASAFLWTGDVIYADDFEPRRGFGKPLPRPASPETFRKVYHEMMETDYKYVAGNMTVLGAWDDHDYGCNNGDITYPYKLEAAIEFMNFLKYRNHADLSLMEQRAVSGKGVYGVKVIDFATGSELLSDEQAGLEPSVPVSSPLSNKSVAIFMLDVRTFKTPWKKVRPDRYYADYDGDFLGEEQWKWFETAMSRSTAAVNLIVTGLQVHADRFFDGNAVEDWSRFPTAQHRLYNTILKHNLSAPILVSGDVHMAELLRKDCRQAPFDSSPRMLLEVTSSGLTHSWGTNVCARPKEVYTCRSPSIARGLKVGMHLAHINHAWTDLVDVGKQRQEGAKPRFQYALERNFGEFEFDFEARQVVVRILGHSKRPLLSTTWDFDLLSGKVPPNATGKVKLSDYERLHQSVTGGADDWICVNYNGHPSIFLKAYGVASPILLAGFVSMLPLLLPILLTWFGYKYLYKRDKIKAD